MLAIKEKFYLLNQDEIENNFEFNAIFKRNLFLLADPVRSKDFVPGIKIWLSNIYLKVVYIFDMQNFGHLPNFL